MKLTLATLFALALALFLAALYFACKGAFWVMWAVVMLAGEW